MVSFSTLCTLKHQRSQNRWDEWQTRERELLVVSDTSLPAWRATGSSWSYSRPIFPAYSLPKVRSSVDQPLSMENYPLHHHSCLVRQWGERGWKLYPQTLYIWNFANVLTRTTLHVTVIGDSWAPWNHHGERSTAGAMQHSLVRNALLNKSRFWHNTSKIWKAQRVLKLTEQMTLKILTRYDAWSPAGGT